MKIKLTKEVVKSYKNYVRIAVDNSKNTGVGSIRISNKNHRWRYTSSDFMHLLGLSVFMMAYDAEYVEGVKEKTQFKPEALEFVFEGLSPIELVSMSEGCINRKIPLKGRPKPVFDNKGKLLKGVVFEIEDDTPSEVAPSKEEVAEVTPVEESTKTVNTEQVSAASQDTVKEIGNSEKHNKGSKSTSKKKDEVRGTLVGASTKSASDKTPKKKLGSSRVEKKKHEREVSSDNMSERFPGSADATEEKHLEVESDSSVNNCCGDDVKGVEVDLDEVKAEVIAKSQYIDTLEEEQDQLKEQAEEKIKNLEEELGTLKSDFVLYKEQVEKEAEENKKGSSRYSELRKSFWSRLKFLFTGK